MFIKGFEKIALNLDPSKAKGLSAGFNRSTGMSGLQRGWNNLKGAFGGATPPAPKAGPANVSAVKPPMPPTSS